MENSWQLITHRKLCLVRVYHEIYRNFPSTLPADLTRPCITQQQNIRQHRKIKLLVIPKRDPRLSTAVSCIIQMKASGKTCFSIFWVFVIYFMVTNSKSKMCIFIKRNPKHLGYPSILNKSRRSPLFRALLRSQFSSIWSFLLDV